MKSINEIEKQLEKKAMIETKQLVSRIMNEITLFEKEFNLGEPRGFYKDENESSWMLKESFEEHLQCLFDNTYKSKLVKLKTKSLLDKLDLL
jgi:arginine repressor